MEHFLHATTSQYLPIEIQRLCIEYDNGPFLSYPEHQSFHRVVNAMSYLVCNSAEVASSHHYKVVLNTYSPRASPVDEGGRLTITDSADGKTLLRPEKPAL